MPSTKDELYKILDDITRGLDKSRRDITVIRATLAEVELPESIEVDCPFCRARFRGPQSLAEHLYHQHDGPEPPHWIAAEAMAAEPHSYRDEKVNADVP